MKTFKADAPGVFFMALTALLCGAAVMAIEVLGARVIGPVFGASLFVWTSLITVTLVALALGYAAGGLVADKRPSPDILFAIVLAAGVSALLIPLLRGPVLRGFLPLGVRAGSLMSAAALFGPALFLLGFVSPYVVRIAARQVESIGKTVGLVYAVSTFGSFVGTVLTGYFLIARFGVGMMINAVGAGLVGLSAFYFALVRKKRLFALTLLFTLAAFLRPGPPGSIALGDGTRLVGLLDKDTFYGNLRVVDQVSEDGKFRLMLIDGEVQGKVDLATGMSAMPYTYFLEFVPYSMNPGGKRCLLLGMGAGIVSGWYEAMGVKTDVVDINPAVMAAAARYFGSSVSGGVHIADARQYLLSSGESYDFIVMDVFNGDTIPVHLTSAEAFALAKARLAGGGVLAMNLIGGLGDDSFATGSIIKTLWTVFDNVEAYRAFQPTGGGGFGNIVLVASDSTAGAFDLEHALMFDIHPGVEEVVWEGLGGRLEVLVPPEAVVLTDDYNPVDFHFERARHEIRRLISESDYFGLFI